MSSGYEDWIKKVEEALNSINMLMADWQSRWPFDFHADYLSGTDAGDAAMRANRFWWLEQNKSVKRDCHATPNCWLPRGHQGACQSVDLDARRKSRPPAYQVGDFVKVEFPDEATGIGEWMWVRITRYDDAKQLVFGVLDNEPLNEYHGKIELGTELAVHYSKIRDHKRPTEFTKQ
jgi:hypothetical protein